MKLNKLRKASWEESKLFCDSIGGELFSALNGSLEQLHFIFDTFGDNEYWLGIYTLDFINWLNLDGEIMAPETLVWIDMYPQNDAAQTKVMINYRYHKSERSELQNADPENRCFPLCNLGAKLGDKK